MTSFAASIKNPTIVGSDALKRQAILDVCVVLEDGQHKHIDVEMQSLRRGSSRVRWLFNWGAVFTDQLARLGYRVLRLDAALVLKQLPVALARVREALAEGG